MEFSHVPVLAEETIAALNIKPDGVYVDCTAGGGGHSGLVAEKLNKDGLLISFDRDAEAVAVCRERLARFEGRTTCVVINDNFVNLKQNLEKELASRGLPPKVDGIMMDLGVSSYQLDCPERGFSYNSEAPLDMRMDRTAALSAYEVVNEYSEDKLRRIITDYGEERFAGRIASAIVTEREVKPIQTTVQLAEIIAGAIPAKARHSESQHPAKRTFQALRIEVNGELDVIEPAIRDAVEMLKPGGRVAVITFHSLEDRITKNTFSSLASGCTCPRDFPVCVCGNKPVVTLCSKKPIVPGDTELELNFRAHSAKLRAAEKI